MAYTKTLPQSSMFIFACIIYGNLIDNHNKQNHHKSMILVSQIAFAIICLGYGGISTLLKTYRDPISHDADQKTSRLLNQTIQFTGTGIYMITLLQVFNWFSSRNVHWVMAVWTMS